MVGGNRYLVAQEEEPRQQRTRYTCIQFVHRSPDVVQIKSANLSEQMDPGLCVDGALRLDRWLVVDRTRIGKEPRVQCPLAGGFSIRMFDKVS